MASMQLKWRFPGFEEIRRAQGVVVDLRRRSRNMARVAGAGYEASVQQGRTRARGSVITATAAARRDNARRNTLVRALNAGRQ